MITVTFGRWVYMDRNFGVCVGPDPEANRGHLFRHARLVLVEGLTHIAGFHAFLESVARHLGAEPDDVRANVALAVAHFQDPLIRDCWHGAQGALEDFANANDLHTVTFEQLLAVRREEELREAARAAKRSHTKRRRSEFQRVRSELVLAMLDAGFPYVCAVEGCAVSVDLTIDHKMALSRGGTDDLDNLQFMCAIHNSKKRDGPS
jgi:hypothetical protein